MVANIVIARTLLRPEAWLLCRARLLAANLVTLAFTNAEYAPVGGHGGVAFTLLRRDTATATTRAFAPLTPIAPATMNGRRKLLLLGYALAALAPLVLATRRAWGCGSHIRHAFPIDATPQCRAELVRGRTGAHIAVRGQVELHAALPLCIVTFARQRLRVIVLVQRRWRIVQALAQSLAVRLDDQL